MATGTYDQVSIECDRHWWARVVVCLLTMPLKEINKKKFQNTKPTPSPVTRLIDTNLWTPYSLKSVQWFWNI